MFLNTWNKIDRTKEEIDKFIIRVGDFNMPLSVTDKISRHKVIKNIEDSNNTINWLDLNDAYRTL